MTFDLRGARPVVVFWCLGRLYSPQILCFDICCEDGGRKGEKKRGWQRRKIERKGIKEGRERENKREGKWKEEGRERKRG